MSLPRIATYDLLFPIARGGMATVFLAYAQGAAGFERRVAIKVMHPHLSGDFGPEEMLQEARVAGRIRHPNVVPVIDVGQNDDGLFLVMEYVEGTTLSAVLREARRTDERLPLPVALRILSDALCGLHAAHELRDDEGASLAIVHRDFSPQNILLGIDGGARLTDFGIAKAKWRSQTTNTGLVKGKDGYMSPEQMRGGALDRRCDIWAAGVVAWETLAGRRLFAGEPTPEGVLERLGAGPLPLLHETRDGVPVAVGRAVARALEPEEATRCPDAETFRQALLDGFAPGVLPADLGEVAVWVKRAASERLAKIEQRIRSTRAERAEQARAEPALRAEPIAAPPFPPRRGWTWAAVAAGSLFAVAAGAAVLVARPAAPAGSASPVAGGSDPGQERSALSPAAAGSDSASPASTLAAHTDQPPAARVPSPATAASRVHSKPTSGRTILPSPYR
jgi:eukaryotic-like serine/threonine-protein kinase